MASFGVHAVLLFQMLNTVEPGGEGDGQQSMTSPPSVIEMLKQQNPTFSKKMLAFEQRKQRQAEAVA